MDESCPAARVWLQSVGPARPSCLKEKSLHAFCCFYNNRKRKSQEDQKSRFLLFSSSKLEKISPVLYFLSFAHAAVLCILPHAHSEQATQRPSRSRCAHLRADSLLWLFPTPLSLGLLLFLGQLLPVSLTCSALCPPVMPNFMHQLAWATGRPDVWVSMILGVSMRELLGEINSGIGALSKADPPPLGGGPHPAHGCPEYTGRLSSRTGSPSVFRLCHWSPPAFALGLGLEFTLSALLGLQLADCNFGTSQPP